MSEKAGIWFVYRSHYEGSLGKRVRRLDAPSVFAWFQAQIDEARVASAPGEGATKAVGGPVYGFETVFQAVHKHSLHTPRTMAALRKLLGEHLYVEGGEEHIFADAHSLRVLTDDDEVALAYFFFDDEAVQRSPDRVAWLLHEDPRLPEGDAEGSFRSPVEVSAFTPAGSGEGATYACLLTFSDSESIPGTAGVFPGVRLPGLAAHLRAVVPDSKPYPVKTGEKSPSSADFLDTWPVELRLLRAMLDEGDTTLGPALGRAAAYPLSSISAKNHTRLGTGAFSAARADFLAAAEGHAHGGDPEKSIVHESAHAALLAAHATSHFGYQQWVFFDDRWAVAHPNLAASLLHYTSNWDPFAAVRAPKSAKDAKGAKGGKGPKSARGPKSDEKPGAVKGAKSTKATAAAAAAATKHDKDWRIAVAGRSEDDARAYSPAEGFTEGELINHARFGVGVVVRVEVAKMEAIFAGASRVLVQAGGARR